MKHLRFALLAVPLALAGCIEITVPGPPETPTDACGAYNFESLTGAPISTLDLSAYSDVRVIRPNQPVTLDLRPTRLNLELNGIDQLVRAYCG